MAFNDRLKEARLLKGMTQEQLAKAIGVAKSTITGYEKGNSEPDVRKIQLMLRELNVDANYLWQDEMNEVASNNKLLLNISEYPLIVKYRRLNDSGKEYIDSQLDYALSQGRYNLEKKTVPASQSDVG